MGSRHAPFTSSWATPILNSASTILTPSPTGGANIRRAGPVDTLKLEIKDEAPGFQRIFVDTPERWRTS